MNTRSPSHSVSCFHYIILGPVEIGENFFLFFSSTPLTVCPHIWYHTARKPRSGRKKARRKAHTTLCEKHSRDHHNTYKCNIVRDKNGRDIPVFHIHGEKDRKHSLVLSYYSYANMIYHLIEMNKDRKNIYEEHQKPL